MTTHPFPEREPDVTVVPRPEAELREVLRTDAGGFFVPLEVGAEVKWSFYDWPERRLTNVSHTRVVGKVRYRGEDCLDIVDQVIWPEEEHSWTRWLYLMKEETLSYVLHETHKAGGVSTIWEDEVIPWPLRLHPGLRWEDRELSRCDPKVVEEANPAYGTVDGPFEVKAPAGSYLCLRENYWWCKADGTGGALAETYVNGNGRTLYFRRFNGPAWRNYEELGKAGVPEREFEGVMWRLWYECLPEIALG